ncbi:hypothetical protein BAE44_0025892 [Dichanthelium oligosanthes]|uniref:Pectinesterase inhibitor domain-containing protein n=1 Tax=Dichanthelium oligosanthes TaxID=888268 RepID=A0A1E5UJV0_9POAL|nr:hypothetical protein BAE44_0025892 [Dichanthelium oligosanthes]
MAMATAVLLQLLVATCTAVVATNEESTTSHHTPALSPPSPAAASFLRSSCAAVDLWDACYRILLPYAGSFHGSIARVARAATAIAAARRHGFADELARLKLRAPRAGRMANMTLASCAETVAGSDMDANTTLGYLDNLVAGVRSKRAFEWEHSLAMNWLGSAFTGMWQCTDWIYGAGEGVAALPAMKEVIAGCTTVSPYMHIALDLTYAVKF